MADEEQQEQQEPKSREGREQAAALDRVTDLVPEKQLDENRVRQAMLALAASQKADKEAQKKRDKELAAVKIDMADVEVIVCEFEVDKKLAERRLRECGGDLNQALRTFL